MDTYPATLAHDPHRLAELAGDIGWVEAAIRTVGVDQVLAVLRTAAGVAPADAAVAAMLTVVAGQARNLRSPGPVDQPGFAARQMCLQATESGLSDLADAARSRLVLWRRPGRCWLRQPAVPHWRTLLSSAATIRRLGR